MVGLICAQMSLALISRNNKIAENSKPNNKNDFLDDLQTVLTS